MNRSECAALLAVACAAYDRDVAPAMLDAWCEFLVDLEPDEAARALREHVTECPHFPKVSDIRQRIASVRIGRCDPGAAWREVRRAITNIGSYGSPSFADEATEAAVEALGWRDMCLSKVDDLPTLRAQFERYYRAHHERQMREANVGALEAARRSLALSAGTTDGHAPAALPSGDRRPADALASRDDHGERR